MDSPQIHILRLFLYSILLFLLVLAPVYFWGDIDDVKACVLGYAVSILSIFFSLFSIRWGFNKKNKQFYQVLIGGMILRLAIVAVVVYVLIKVLKWSLWGFLISLVVFYLFLQYHEIKMVNALLEKKPSQKE